MERIINFLKKNNQTISTMESCTGGLFASELTNVSGSGDVFNLDLVTYSNEFKEYFGVSKKTIDEYTVYSNQVSQEMAKRVCEISKSDYSIGITGMLGRKDPNNDSNEVDTVYISIYKKDENKYFDYRIKPEGEKRLDKKQYTIQFIKEKLCDICK